MAPEVRGELRNVLATGASLAEQREHAGMTQAELAARAEVPLEEVVRAEQQRTTPDDYPLLRRLFAAVRPPTPPGWDEGHEHDLTLTLDERGRTYRDGSERDYWDFVDAYRDEVERPGWYRRARAAGPVHPVVVAEDGPRPRRRYDAAPPPLRAVTGDNPEDRQLRALAAVLDGHDVDYVGAQAARFHGWAGRTRDSDVTPDLDPANLDRLGAALAELGARPEAGRLADSAPDPVTADWLPENPRSCWGFSGSACLRAAQLLRTQTGRGASTTTTRARATRAAFSAPIIPPAAANRPRPVSSPQATPAAQHPRVRPASAPGRTIESEPNRASPPSHPRSATRTERSAVAVQSRGSARATSPSERRSVSDRATQCWTGNVTTAAAPLQYVHRTEIGAAAAAPSVRVARAKKT